MHTEPRCIKRQYTRQPEALGQSRRMRLRCPICGAVKVARVGRQRSKGNVRTGLAHGVPSAKALGQGQPWGIRTAFLFFTWLTEETEGLSTLIRAPHPALVVVTYDVKHQNPLHTGEHTVGVGNHLTGGTFGRRLERRIWRKFKSFGLHSMSRIYLSLVRLAFEVSGFLCSDVASQLSVLSLSVIPLSCSGPRQLRWNADLAEVSSRRLNWRGLRSFIFKIGVDAAPTLKHCCVCVRSSLQALVMGPAMLCSCCCNELLTITKAPCGLHVSLIYLSIFS